MVTAEKAEISFSVGSYSFQST